MSEGRPWYREPESFVAVAALIVSLSALGVGLYEARLQRQHDRAEVWPNLEVGTFTTGDGAKVIVDNTGLGPAIVESVAAMVDDTVAHSAIDRYSRSGGWSRHVSGQRIDASR
jgi:hypothetical protein